jgi:ribonuclease D
MDTEFHRERTYFPKLALVQLCSSEELALVDPLAVDVSSLGRLFESPALAVLHAAQQDLDVLTHACGAVPSRLYDTQLAAGFVGYSTPSLVALLQSELRVSAAKGDRLTDWLRRPLTADQQNYAASDVAHLLALQDRLDVQLDRLGRLAWVHEACEELRRRPISGTSPDDAWLRLKDVRILKPKARGVAKALAAWRERRAMSTDSPVRQVLPDLAILGIAQKQPRSLAELAQARGVDERFSRGVIGQQLLEAVAEGLQADAHLPAPDGDELERSLRPAVNLVSAWIGELARSKQVDVALLATRSDLVALLRGDADARLAHGWRATLVGDDIQRLLTGRAALTFERGHGLRLVAVSGLDEAP